MMIEIPILVIIFFTMWANALFLCSLVGLALGAAYLLQKRYGHPELD